MWWLHAYRGWNSYVRRQLPWLPGLGDPVKVDLWRFGFDLIRDGKHVDELLADAVEQVDGCDVENLRLAAKEDNAGLDGAG